MRSHAFNMSLQSNDIPAHVVDVGVLVEVVAILADVVQLGVEGCVVFTPTRAAVSLTEC